MEFIWPFFKLRILLHKIFEKKNSIQIFSEKKKWTLFISFEICFIYLINNPFFLFCYEDQEAPIHVMSCSKPPSICSAAIRYSLQRADKKDAEEHKPTWRDRNYQCLHWNEKKENNRKNCKNKEMAKIYQMKKFQIFLFWENKNGIF